jgi:hypothetical protein
MLQHPVGRSAVTSDGEPFALVDAQAADIDGDVLLVLPARRLAQRLVRDRSRYNTLLVTERCE